MRKALTRAQTQNVRGRPAVAKISNIINEILGAGQNRRSTTQHIKVDNRPLWEVRARPTRPVARPINEAKRTDS